MYQLALKLEASFLVATQATNAVQCFGKKGSNHGQWSRDKRFHVLPQVQLSLHAFSLTRQFPKAPGLDENNNPTFYLQLPKGLLAWRPTLRICRHDLPRLGASPLEGLERLKLKEFWIIINKWYFVKWSILSNYQQLFWIILIVDHEYIKRYKHYVINKHIFLKTYREKISCKNQRIMESCHDVVNRGLVLDSWMILTTWLIPGERCIHGIGMAFSCCNIYVRSTGDMCTFFFQLISFSWQFSLQCQVLSFLVVLKFVCGCITNAHLVIYDFLTHVTSVRVYGLALDHSEKHIYVAGESAGGNTIYRWSGLDSGKVGGTIRT